MDSTLAPTAPPKDDDGFFGYLLRCTALSAVALGLATALHLRPWVGMLGGALPLIWYHIGYLKPRAAKGLSQTAVDSVYYFGFLVTIGALGCSAVSLAISDGKEPLTNVAFQFGLGLLATGYAVVARMHLNSITRLVDDASPEAVLDRYVQRSRELVTNVELASTQFALLAESLMAKSQAVADTAQRTTEKSMLDVARIFDEQLRGTLASAREGLQEIRGLVNETSFVQEREELLRSVRATLECTKELNGALRDFTQRTAEGARTSEAVNNTSLALNATLRTLHINLDSIGGEQGQMVSTARALSEAQAVITESTTHLSEVIRELDGMTGTVSGMSLTFKSIKTLTQKANEQMTALVDSCERLETATDSIADSADATRSLADNLSKANQALPELGGQAQSLQEKLQGLQQAVGAVETQLQALPRPTQEIASIGSDLGEALGQVQRILASANSEAKSLAGHSASNAEALERASKLASNSAQLQEATATVNELLEGLGTSVGRLQGNISKSSESFAAALALATESLESDVKRSSEAARIFSERLTDTAQHIIDRTREARAA